MEIEQASNTLEQRLFAHAEKNLIPINGSLELLPLCNMNCDMCYVRMSADEVKQKGRIHTAEEWLSVGKQLSQQGVTFLLLTGGEPLLHPQFKEIYLGLKKLGFIITVNTNGTLINEEWIQFFADNKPRRMNITLYGSNPQTYDHLCHYKDGFDKVIQAIKGLRAHDIDVKMSATIAKKNKDDIPEIIRIAKELDVPVNVDTYLQVSVRERNKPFDQQSRMTPQEAAYASLLATKCQLSEEEFSAYVVNKLYTVENTSVSEPIPSHMTCMAGRCSFTINWQGELRPCVILDQPAMSVFEHDFTESWNHIVKETDKIYLNGKCTSCKLRSLCRTCAAAALYETGTYDGVPEYLCQYSEEMYRLLQQQNIALK